MIWIDLFFKETQNKRKQKNWREFKFKICVFINDCRFKIVYILEMEDTQTKQTNKWMRKKIVEIIAEMTHVTQDDKTKYTPYDQISFHFPFGLSTHNRNRNHSIKSKAFLL